MTCPKCETPVREGETFLTVYTPSRVHPDPGTYHLRCDRRMMQEHAASLGPAKR